MRKNKTGVLFLVSILALAGVGVGYAGFTDTISIYGSVETGTVDINVVDTAYSGTFVYKVWDLPVEYPSPPGDNYFSETEEILIYRGFMNVLPTEDEVVAWAEDAGGQAELVASSWAEPGDEDDKVKMTWDNIFPCIDFTCDFIVHYEGSIPAKIDPDIIIETMYEDNDPNTGWLEDLWNNYDYETDGFGINVEAHRCTPLYLNGTTGVAGVDIWENHPVGPDYQLHYCNYVYVEVTIHLPQSNDYQDLYGEFETEIGVTQWNDQCEED